MKYSIIFCFFLAFKVCSFGQTDPVYYDNIYPYHDGYSLVTLGGKFGIINENFEEVIPPILESINNYDLSDYFFDGLLYGVINDSLVLFDTLGNRIKSSANSEIYPPPFWNKNYTIDSLTISGSEGSRGCTSPNGKLIIPYEYRYIYKGLKNHIVAYRVERSNGFDSDGTAHQDKRITTVYDRNGNIIREHEGRVFCWNHAGFYFNESAGSYTVTNSEFESVRPEKFKSISVVDSLCWVQSNTGWGLINSSFEYKIQPQFDYLYVNPYWVVVGKNQKFGFVTREGIQISKVEFDGEWTQYTGDDRIIVAYKHDHLIFLNIKGECIHNCDEPNQIIKFYPNGNKMVEGSFANYWKTGTWNYYRNDSLNSLQKIIEYSDSTIIFKDVDSTGQVIDTWEEQRMLTSHKK